MKNFQVALLLVLPLVAFAIPAPEAIEELKHALVERQNNSTGGTDILGGLGGLLGDLVNSIGPLLDLLNPDTFKQLQSVLAGAAKLLTDKTVNDIIKVVGGAAKLLTDDFVNAISGIIDAVSPLINALVQLISGVLGAIFG
ncbi:hypothetical protein BJY01DRAFT_255258 [Aspergillus pseudoustus]|uniref:Hydrophobic surface binding protein A-domain-containing protein n=1 Tax=Aspergillus pseudoustus TaxID=1810923 RepID=A0ABR4IM18_9EURO